MFQALYLMNSPLVVEASRKLVEASASAGDDAQRVDALYRSTLARTPSDSERQRALAFVARAVAPQQPSMGADVGKDPSAERAAAAREGWRALAQVLLVSNEFLYVD